MSLPNNLFTRSDAVTKIDVDSVTVTQLQNIDVFVLFYAAPLRQECGEASFARKGGSRALLLPGEEVDGVTQGAMTRGVSCVMVRKERRRSLE